MNINDFAVNDLLLTEERCFEITSIQGPSIHVREIKEGKPINNPTYSCLADHFEDNKWTIIKTSKKRVNSMLYRMEVP